MTPLFTELETNLARSFLEDLLNLDEKPDQEDLNNNSSDDHKQETTSDSNTHESRSRVDLVLQNIVNDDSILLSKNDNSLMLDVPFESPNYMTQETDQFALSSSPPIIYTFIDPPVVEHEVEIRTSSIESPESIEPPSSPSSIIVQEKPLVPNEFSFGQSFPSGENYHELLSSQDTKNIADDGAGDEEIDYDLMINRIPVRKRHKDCDYDSASSVSSINNAPPNKRNKIEINNGESERNGEKERQERVVVRSSSEITKSIVVSEQEQTEPIPHADSLVAGTNGKSPFDPFSHRLAEMFETIDKREEEVEELQDGTSSVVDPPSEKNPHIGSRLYQVETDLQIDRPTMKNKVLHISIPKVHLRNNHSCPPRISSPELSSSVSSYSDDNDNDYIPHLKEKVKNSGHRRGFCFIYSLLLACISLVRNCSSVFLVVSFRRNGYGKHRANKPSKLGEMLQCFVIAF